MLQLHVFPCHVGGFNNLSSGLHSQLNSLGVKERLLCLLSAEPSDLLLEQSEAFGVTTEAYRLWGVAAGYGQACSLYT